MPYYRKQLVTTELDPRLAALVTGSTYALLLEGDPFSVPTIIAQGNDEGTVARGGVAVTLSNGEPVAPHTRNATGDIVYATGNLFILSATRASQTVVK